MGYEKSCDFSRDTWSFHTKLRVLDVDCFPAALLGGVSLHGGRTRGPVRGRAATRVRRRHVGHEGRVGRQTSEGIQVLSDSRHKRPDNSGTSRPPCTDNTSPRDHLNTPQKLKRPQNNCFQCSLSKTRSTSAKEAATGADQDFVRGRKIRLENILSEIKWASIPCSILLIFRVVLAERQPHADSGGPLLYPPHGDGHVLHAGRMRGGNEGHTEPAHGHQR